MANHCGFSGNPDLYGLGIRLSLYIQSLTVVIVATFISKSKYNSFLSNTNLSLFISSWVIIVKVSISREVCGVELGIFPVLIFSAYAAVVILLKNWNTPKFLWGSTLTTLATASYWLWFFWSGLDVLPPSGCSRDYAFFFAKVDLYGWYRTLLKVAFIIQLALYTLFVFIPLLFSGSDPDDISEESSSTSKKLAKNFAMIALLAISILSTELTISWNHIHGVTSPSTLRSVGQLVPLVIALGQLIWVLYLALRGEEKMRVNEENESGLCPSRYH